jgi:Cft2 family RNA processing exonuclease
VQTAVAADYVVVESTYGDREHPVVNVVQEMLAPIKRAIARGGVVVAPVFAVGRAQSMQYALSQLIVRSDLHSHFAPLSPTVKMALRIACANASNAVWVGT